MLITRILNKSKGNAVMDRDQLISSFVKGNLGCQCPEEVFSSIEFQPDVRLNIDLRLKSKIVVGKKLLIYIIDVPDTRFVHENLLTLFFFGKDEKELKAYKTMRLVLVTDNVEEVKSMADSMYNDLAGVMDLEGSIHLHVVGRNDIKF